MGRRGSCIKDPFLRPLSRTWMGNTQVVVLKLNKPLLAETAKGNLPRVIAPDQPFGSVGSFRTHCVCAASSERIADYPRNQVPSLHAHESSNDLRKGHQPHGCISRDHPGPEANRSNAAGESDRILSGCGPARGACNCFGNR